MARAARCASRPEVERAAPQVSLSTSVPFFVYGCRRQHDGACPGGACCQGVAAPERLHMCGRSGRSSRSDALRGQRARGPDQQGLFKRVCALPPALHSSSCCPSLHVGTVASGEGASFLCAASGRLPAHAQGGMGRVCALRANRSVLLSYVAPGTPIASACRSAASGGQLAARRVWRCTAEGVLGCREARIVKQGGRVSYSSSMGFCPLRTRASFV